MRNSFYEKGADFNEKKIYLFILTSIIKKNMRILLGKINDNSLKKNKIYRMLKSTQKLNFSVKNRGDFFESAPPPRFTILTH